MSKKVKASEKLEELSQAASLEDNTGGFMEPHKKRGRGRPRKADTAENNKKEPEDSLASQPHVVDIQAQIENNKNLVRPLFGMMSDAGVKYAGTKEAEIDAQTMLVLVDSSAICIHQYLPDILGRHAALLLLSVTFTQWGLRVALLRQQIMAKERVVHEFAQNPNPPSAKPPGEKAQPAMN